MSSGDQDQKKKDSSKTPEKVTEDRPLQESDRSREKEILREIAEKKVDREGFPGTRK